jgi:hypothetical protein
MKVGLVVMDENPADALRRRVRRTHDRLGRLPARDVADQLRRYADVVDWALLYPPHFGVDRERVHANELSLIDVASGWTS